MRAFLVAVSLFAVWVGWHADKARRQRDTVNRIRRVGGYVRYDFESSKNTSPNRQEPFLIAWIRRNLGPDWLHDVEEVNFAHTEFPNKPRRYNYDHTSDDVVDLLVGLPKLRRLVLHYEQATDDSFQVIGSLTSLEDLEASDAESVTDKGIESLRGLRNLKRFRISNAPLSDRCLKTVSQMPSIEELWLYNHWIVGTVTRFTDEGLMTMAHCLKLKTLVVSDTGVTDDAIQSLQTRLPGCRVEGGWKGPMIDRNGKQVPFLGSQ
ncbi:MAG TPA: hypothetical protein VHC22_33940 [Pirellulales bacterium]|nr:hypothetical protein [Pirellulales bacterium]